MAICALAYAYVRDDDDADEEDLATRPDIADDDPRKAAIAASPYTSEHLDEVAHQYIFEQFPNNNIMK
jgi:hypothetical protein